MAAFAVSFYRIAFCSRSFERSTPILTVEENSTLAIDDPKYATNEAKIKEAYEQAKPFYEKAKELEPDNKDIWGQQLLRIYWALNKAEYEALEKEMAY